MATSPPSTGPRWAYGPGAVLPDPPISTAQRAAGFAINQILTAGQLNGLFKNLGEWITYLRGPRAAYTSLDAAADVMAVGDTVAIYENDSTVAPGTALTGYQTGGVYGRIAASSDVVVVSLSAPPGTIYVYPRSNPDSAALQTFAPSLPLPPTSMTVYGDLLAITYSTKVQLFRISTGTSLWIYDHGGTLKDVQVNGAYVVAVGAAGTGGYHARLLSVASGTLVASINHGADLSACAIYGLSVAVAGAAGTGAYNARGYQIASGLSLVWSATIGASTVMALRTDGRNLYAAEGSSAYCISWADGGVLATANNLGMFAPTYQWLAVDQGGVYVLATDGSTAAYVQRLALGTCSIVWQAPVASVNQLGIATDGARIWSTNTTGGSSKGILTFARGNCAGQWTKVDTSVTTYQRFGWLLVPGVE